VRKAEDKITYEASIRRATKRMKEGVKDVVVILGKRKGDIFYLFIFSAISCALIASSIVTSGASFPSRQFMKWVFN